MEMPMSTELTLGLPGTDESARQKSPTTVKSNKRYSPDTSDNEFRSPDAGNAPPAKAQVVGWPPVRSYRKSCFEQKKSEGDVAGTYVKVSMVGAPYLRKIDLKLYKSYSNLLMALEDMFKFSIGEYSESEGYKNGCDYTPTYEDKDGDWMMVGDVPWDMFIVSCKKLKIMKGSEARGLNSL